MLRIILAVSVLLARMFASLLKRGQRNPSLKVAVMADGRISVNGAPATIQSLWESLKKLSEQIGVVWYYREAANTAGPAVVKQVVLAIIDARLPIRFSSRPDYSDTIGPDGKPIRQ